MNLELDREVIEACGWPIYNSEKEAEGSKIRPCTQKIRKTAAYRPGEFSLYYTENNTRFVKWFSPSGSIYDALFAARAFCQTNACMFSLRCEPNSLWIARIITVVANIVTDDYVIEEQDEEGMMAICRVILAAATVVKVQRENQQ